jgi:hypothetical protein
MARQPVVWDLLPGCGVGDELAEAATNARIPVDRAEAHAHH